MATDMSTNHDTQQTGLDFSDIHQDAELSTPIPKVDPSWDAHKVYFNERESSDIPKSKGDEFDGFFAQSQVEQEEEIAAAVLAVALEKMNQTNNNNKTTDETLDPLGWPVQGNFDQSKYSTNQTHSDDPKAFTANMDGDGDDLDLIRHRSDQNPADEEEAGIEVLANGVHDVVVLDDVPMSKGQRLQMYESRGVDEDSSVEEGENHDEEEDWDDGRQVDYIMQDSKTHDDDDDSTSHQIHVKDVPSYEETKQDFAHFDVAAASAAAADSAPTATTKSSSGGGFLASQRGVKTNAGKKNKKEKQPKSGGGPVPLLRPPPEEKLQKWKESRERAKKPTGKPWKIEAM